MRVLVCLLVLVAGCASAPAPAPKPAPESPTLACSVGPFLVPPVDRILAEEYARLVEIVVACPDGRVFGGSGTRVRGTTILTARHVVDCDGEDPAQVIVCDGLFGLKFEAVVEGSATADAARLDAPFIPEVSPVAVASVRTGERLCAVVAEPERGRRCGELWPPVHDVPGDLLIDFVAEHGNSGAGVWDASGSLVGVLVHLRKCMGTNTDQVCTAGATSMASRLWLIAP